jgi:hypothetical protein
MRIHASVSYAGHAIARYDAIPTLVALRSATA